MDWGKVFSFEAWRQDRALLKGLRSEYLTVQPSASLPQKPVHMTKKAHDMLCSDCRQKYVDHVRVRDDARNRIEVRGVMLLSILVIASITWVGVAVVMSPRPVASRAAVSQDAPIIRPLVVSVLGINDYPIPINRTDQSSIVLTVTLPPEKRNATMLEARTLLILSANNTSARSVDVTKIVVSDWQSTEMVGQFSFFLNPYLCDYMRSTGVRCENQFRIQSGQNVGPFFITMNQALASNQVITIAFYSGTELVGLWVGAVP